jgi:hypothetical protein
MIKYVSVFLSSLDYHFSVDYFRCGKCSMEFSMMEEFVLHKLFVEQCNLMLWVSERIHGLQIPKYMLLYTYKHYLPFLYQLINQLKNSAA